jgi:predicted enzyme involved in methoxymalonyl-ACP biosynthesis
MNQVVEHARKIGLPQVTAQYIPTAKNGMVKDFYQQFGFEKITEEPNGTAHWLLQTESYHARTTFMKTVEL